MSSFYLLSESLKRSVDCARRIADLSVASLNCLGEFQDEIRRLRRDLPHFNEQVMADFRGDTRLAADLRHALRCVAEDSDRLADWLAPVLQQLREFLGAVVTVPEAALQYGRANQEAFEECERRRQAVFESCNQAQLVANRVCTAADDSGRMGTATTDPVLPAPPPEAHADASTKPDADMRLTERERELLCAYLALGAVGKNSAVNLWKAAQKADSDGKAQSYKQANSGLVKRKLLEVLPASEKKRMHLTPKGRQEAAKPRP